MPARTASSTTYWIAGLSTIGSISLGVAFVAGRKRVPNPAAGMTALVTGALMAATLVGSVRRDGLRDAPLVASLGLRDVEREVGRTDERRRAVAVVGVDGDADRDGDGEVGRGAVQRPAADPLADPAGEVLRAFEPGFREQDDELLPAVARNDVDLPDLLADAVGNLDEYGVADLMPVLVVDLLEMVEVEHQQRQRPMEPRGAVDLSGQRLLEEAVVAEAGEP